MKEKLNNEQIEAYRQEHRQRLLYFNSKDRRIIYRRHGGKGKIALNYGNPLSYLVLAAQIIALVLVLCLTNLWR